MFLALTIFVCCACGQREAAEPDPPAQAEVRFRRPQGFTEGFLRHDKRPNLIVFVHGVLGDGVGTWTNENGAYWPQLLVTDPTFDDADVFVFSYPTPPMRRAYDINEIASTLVLAFRRFSLFQEYQRVVFICHSMGGLVTRDFLLQLRPLPKQVPLLMMYSTPVTGAQISRLASLLSDNPQFKYMLPQEQNAYAQTIDTFWQRTNDDPVTSYGKNIETYCAYEVRPTFGVAIVDRVSATHSCLHQQAIDADHLGIVKPATTGGLADSHAYFTVAYRTLKTQPISTPPQDAQLRAARDTVAVSLNRFIVATEAVRTPSLDPGVMRKRAAEYTTARNDLLAKETELRSLIVANWPTDRVAAFDQLFRRVGALDATVRSRPSLLLPDGEQPTPEELRRVAVAHDDVLRNAARYLDSLPTRKRQITVPLDAPMKAPAARGAPG